jgi:hypothetical protein
MYLRFTIFKFRTYLQPYRQSPLLRTVNVAGKRPLERPRHRWEDGIKMYLWEIGWGVWSGFTWLRMGTVGGLL